MSSTTKTNKRKADEISTDSKDWCELVRVKDRQRASRIVHECDWSWAEKELKFPSELVQQYQLFILCRIAARDIQLKEGNGSWRLGLHTNAIGLGQNQNQ
jgi:hypothetical protein